MRFEPRLDLPVKPRPLVNRLGWLIVYWFAGVALVGAIAWLIRLVLSS